jgi:hypothetical protein
MSSLQNKKPSVKTTAAAMDEDSFDTKNSNFLT